MRRSLKDADDLLAVVKVLEMWVNQWSKRDVKLLPSKKELSKNEQGVRVLKMKGKEVNKDLPPLNKVGVLFLTTHLFCINYFTLLSHPHAGLSIPPNCPRRLLRHSSPTHPSTPHPADALRAPRA
jgi:gephyrin